MSELDLGKVTLKNVSDDGSYAEFVVGPLERGFGTTLGNGMRRVLLSSLPGAAASSIKIDGVTHEFSTVPGVREDVTEVVLNVKDIVVKLENCDAKTVHVDIKGPCEFTADMIKSDSDFSILSNNLIATLEENSNLIMDITFTSGVGYSSAEQNRSIMPAIMNVIPVDSLYSPVRKVNYKVVDTRVGQITDYDELTLQVWTNKVLSAKDAVVLAARNLINHLNLFCVSGNTINVASEFSRRTMFIPAPGDLTLDDLGFSARAYNSLKRAEILYLSQLMKMNLDEISSLRNLGKKSCDEIVAKLRGFGWKNDRVDKIKKPKSVSEDLIENLIEKEEKNIVKNDENLEGDL